MKRRCPHIPSCRDEAACEVLDRKLVVRRKAANERWAKSRWGNMPDWLRLTYVGDDLMGALGFLSAEEMRALEKLLGPERYRLLLNATERAGCFVLETTNLPATVLP